MELRHQHRQDHDRELEPERAKREPEPDEIAWPGKRSRTSALPSGDARSAELRRIRTAVGALRAGGAPLPGAMAATYGRLLGIDLSDVRVHRGAAANQAAKSLGAAAFTHGRDIALRDHIDLDSAFGRHVLAHELVHVAQRARGGGSDGAVGAAGSAIETEAERGAAALLAGTPFAVDAHGALPAISRYGEDEEPAANAPPVTVPGAPPPTTTATSTSTEPAPQTAPADAASVPPPPAPATDPQAAPSSQPADPSTAPASSEPTSTGPTTGPTSGPTSTAAPVQPGATPSSPRPPMPQPRPAPTPVDLDARVQEELEKRADPRLKTDYSKAVAGVDSLRLQALQFSFQPTGVWNTVFETFTAAGAFQDHWGQIYSGNAYRGGRSWADTAQAWIEGLRGVVHIIGDIASVVSAWAGLAAIVTGALALVLSETVIGGIALGAIAAIAAEVATVAGAIKLLTDIIDFLLGIIQMIILIVRARNSKDPGERARFAQLLHKEANDFGSNVTSIGVQVATMAISAGIGAGLSKGAKGFLTTFREEFGKAISPALKPWTLGARFAEIGRLATPVATGVGKGVSTRGKTLTGAPAERRVLNVEVEGGLVGISRLQRNALGRVTRNRETIAFTSANQMRGAKLRTLRAAVGRAVAVNTSGTVIGLGGGQLQAEIKAPKAADGQGTASSSPSARQGNLGQHAQAGADLSALQMWPSQIEMFEASKGPLAGAIARTQRQYELAEEQAGPELAAQVRQAFQSANNSAGQARFGAMTVQQDAAAGQANTQQGLQQTGQARDGQTRMGDAQSQAGQSVDRIQQQGGRLQSPPPKEGALGWLYNQTIGRIGGWIASAQRWVTNLVGKWAMSLAGFSKEEMDIAGIENDMREDALKDETSTQEAQDAATRADEIQQTVFQLQEDKTRDEQYAIQGMADAQRFIAALEDADRQLGQSITNGQGYVAAVTPIIRHELETESAGAAIDDAYVAPLVAYANTFAGSVDGSNVGGQVTGAGNRQLDAMKAAFPELGVGPGKAAIAAAGTQYDTAFAELAGSARAQAETAATTIQTFVGTTDYDGVHADARALDQLAADFDTAAQHLADQLCVVVNNVIGTYNAHIQAAIDVANQVPDEPDAAVDDPAGADDPDDASSTDASTPATDDAPQGSGFARGDARTASPPAQPAAAPSPTSATSPTSPTSATSATTTAAPPAAPAAVPPPAPPPPATSATTAPAKPTASAAPDAADAAPRDAAKAGPHGKPGAHAPGPAADAEHGDDHRGAGPDAAPPAPSASASAAAPTGNAEHAAAAATHRPPLELEPVRELPIPKPHIELPPAATRARRRAANRNAAASAASSAPRPERAAAANDHHDAPAAEHDSPGEAPASSSASSSSPGAEAAGHAIGRASPGRGVGRASTTENPVAHDELRTPPPAAPELTHRTEMWAGEANDDRTTVGVGERVRFTSNTRGRWSASAVGHGGTAEPRREATTYRWFAPAAPGSYTVTQTTAEGGTQSVTMTVIAPTGVDFWLPGELHYPAGQQGAGMETNVKFLPFTVAFDRTSWLEVPGGPSNITGYFTDHTPPDHHPNTHWLAIGEGNGGPTDTAAFWGFPAPWSAGSFEWAIPNKYKVRGESGDGVEFATVTQRCVMQNDGTTTVSKGSASVTRSPNAAPPAPGHGHGGGHARGHAGAAGGLASALEALTAPTAGLGRGDTLAQDLGTAARATPFDAAHVLDLIANAPIAEVTAVARNATLIRQLERKMPPAQADAIRARLARRLFLDGHQPIAAWRLITGDDRARRQLYLDAYGTVPEQRAFEDAVIADPSNNTGFMIRAFDSYWDVEARREIGSRWNADVIRRMHTALKRLPDGDVRSQDVNGRVWQTIVLSVDPALIDRAAFGGGEFTVGAHADVESTQQMGSGTTLTADAAVGDTTLQVTETARFAVGDTLAMGHENNTQSVDPNYDRVTITAIAANQVTFTPALAHPHASGDSVGRIDNRGGSVKLGAAAAVGATTLQVTDGTHFSVGDSFAIGTGASNEPTDANYDHGRVTAIAGNVLTIDPALCHAHRVDDVVTRFIAVGNNSALTAAAATGATTLEVGAGTSFAINDVVVLGAGPHPTYADANFDWGRVSGIAGNVLTISRALTHDHAVGDTVVRLDAAGSAAREVNWLDATVRHEIAHAVDAAIPAVVQGFTIGIGGWWTGAEPAVEADFDHWVSELGADAWNGATSGDPPATTAITDADKALVRTAVTQAVQQGTSLYAMGLAADHPVVKNRANNVPVLVAAEACLSRGDNFFNAPEDLYTAGGKLFLISNWYQNFMICSETVRAKRVSDYTLYAPAEYFAEAYTVFYEEAGRPGVTDESLGRLIPDAQQREWLRTNIHNRHLAPAGAAGGGAPAPAGGAPPLPPGVALPGEAAQAAPEGGVQPGGGGTGKQSHRPGP